MAARHLRTAKNGTATLSIGRDRSTAQRLCAEMLVGASETVASAGAAAGGRSLHGLVAFALRTRACDTGLCTGCTFQESCRQTKSLH